MAQRLVQAPNTYPDWIRRSLPLQLDFGSRVLSNHPPRWVEVGPPATRLRYRLVEPRNYGLSYQSTNWQSRGKTWFKFTFRHDPRGATNRYTATPRGTVVLLHGYSLDQGRLVPWAFRLAQEGWRCVLVDLRGHGKSTGRRIHFGLVETNDLSRLLDELSRNGQLAEPVAALGESYGAALALRWKTVEPRLRSVVAFAPYAELSRAVLNIRQHNAPFIPASWVKSGLRHVPQALGIDAAELDLSTVLQRSPVSALFIASDSDQIVPPADIRRLTALAASPSQLLIVPQATHEALLYFFNDLVEPVRSWLEQSARASAVPNSPTGRRN